MKKIKFKKNEILNIQKNRFPYLMIDYATEVLPGKHSKGYKILPEGEWFFNVHWEDDPNMPGMLQIEAMVQMSSLAILSLPGNSGKILYLLSANNLKFHKKVLPKSKLFLETKILDFKRGIANCKGRAFVAKSLVSEADFRLVLPDELFKYKKS